MLKHSQYLAGSIYRPSQPSPKRQTVMGLEIDPDRMREWTRKRNTTSQNNKQQRLEEIKRKYSKEKSIEDSYQSNALKEISLRNSNYNSGASSKAAFINYSAQKILDRCSMASAFPTTPQNYILKRETPTKKEEIKEIEHRSSESLYNFSKYAQRNTRLDTSIISKSIQRNQFGKQRQQRMGSIDKINMKIYKILNSLNENNQKKQPHISRFGENQSIDKLQKDQKIEKISKQNSLRISQIALEEKKDSEIYSKKDLEVNKSHTSILSRCPLPVKESRKIDSSIINHTRRFSVNSNMDARLSRNSFTIDKSRRQDSLFKNRDIDAEIKRIQDRIKKTEEQKKKLNIGFDQWKENRVSKRQPSHTKVSEKACLLLQRKNRLYNNVSSFKINTEQSDISSFNYNQKQKKVRFQQSSVLKETKSSRSKNENELNPLKISVCTEEISKIQTRRLIQTLKKQVTYDECYRTAKVILSQIHPDKKWNAIKEVLDAQDFILSEEEIKKQFETTPEEHNPFFSVREISQPIEQLVSKYVDSHLHWKQHVKGKFNMDLFKKENFTEQAIDLQKKGSLNVQDLVRFLNIETGNFYRNRDVILLFRRITSNPTVSFKQFLEVLCLP